MRIRTLKTRLLFISVLTFLSVSLTGCPIWHSTDTPVDEFALTEPATKSKFYLYVPSDYEPTRKWPLVVTLHGTPGYDNASRQAKEWKIFAEEHGFIVLAPKLTSAQGVLPVSHSSRMKQLATDEKRVLSAMAETKKRYSIDERNVMISGYSAGGFSMYYIAMRNPNKFSTMVARLCNCNMKVLKALPVSSASRKIHMLIFFSKTGINPIYSKHNPIGWQSWAAFEYLRRQDHRSIEIDAVEGGHHRHPEVAYAFWRKYWPKQQ